MLRCSNGTTTMTAMAETRRPRRWTYADYCGIPADRNRHELIDGRHYVNPAPSPYHQAVSGLLLFELMLRVQKKGIGRVFVAPIDVHLGRGTLVQPDLVVLRPRNGSIVGGKKLTGVPDLLVEVLSPSTRRYDRTQKRRRYERAGVRELWLVDPESRRIDQLVMRGGRYGQPILCTDRIRMRILRGIEIDLAQIW